MVTFLMIKKFIYCLSCALRDFSQFDLDRSVEEKIKLPIRQFGWLTALLVFRIIKNALCIVQLLSPYDNLDKKSIPFS